MQVEKLLERQETLLKLTSDASAVLGDVFPIIELYGPRNGGACRVSIKLRCDEHPETFAKIEAVFKEVAMQWQDELTKVNAKVYAINELLKG